MGFSVTAYAKEKDVTIGAMDKIVYLNLSTDQVYSDYKENAYRATNKYKDFYIGITGETESIASNGKQITLKPPSSAMSFVCDCADKQLKSTVETLSAGDKVIVCGKVKSPDEEKFTVKAASIIAIKNEIKKYEDGYTTADWTVFLKDEVEQYTIGENVCIIPQKWEEQQSEEFWDEYIKDEFSQKSGMVVQLGKETNTELVGIYAFSWEELKEKAAKNRDKKFAEFENTYVEELLVEKLINKKMNYKLGVANSIPTKKTNNVTFDYLHGTKEESGKTVHSELFFVKNDDELIAITYLYKDKPQYSSQVMLLLGSFEHLDD